MKSCATYDDVNLILRLYEQRREEKLRAARAWFGASFHVRSLEELDELCPPGSDPNAYYRMVVTYWNMAASFVVHGVLQPEIFFDSGREMLLVWERVRDVLPAIRKRIQDPDFLDSLEKVSGDCIEWWTAKTPGAYEAFSQRVRAKPSK